MLKATVVNHYRKADANGNLGTTYVWNVTGNSPIELEKFKEDQGVNYREDETTGKPLYFSREWPGQRQVNLTRISRKDGSVQYRLDSLDRQMTLEEVMLQKEAEFLVARKYQNVNTRTIAPVLGAPVTAPAVAAAETEVLENAGGEGLNDAL